MVTLSPMSVAPVCSVGDPLQLTCTAHVEVLRWNILRANEEGTLVNVVNSVVINSRDAVQIRNTPLNSATIAFTRISAQGASPLVTTLGQIKLNISFSSPPASSFSSA